MPVDRGCQTGGNAGCEYDLHIESRHELGISRYGLIRLKLVFSSLQVLLLIMKTKMPDIGIHVLIVYTRVAASHARYRQAQYTNRT